MSVIEHEIYEGNIKAVKLLIEHESCDINTTLNERKTPLFLSLQNTKQQNDEWFQISQLLFNDKNIKVNTECGENMNFTALTLLCVSQHLV